MRQTIKIATVGTFLLFAGTSTAVAEETKAEKKITIEEMEVKLAKLAHEIAEEKVKISQKEALLYDMRLALLKQKAEKRKAEKK